MTVPPDDPPPAQPPPSMGRPIAGVVLLLILLAVPLVFSLPPVDPGVVRVGGVALAWWYAGVFAPLLGLGIAAWAVPGGKSAGEPRQRR